MSKNPTEERRKGARVTFLSKTPVTVFGTGITTASKQAWEGYHQFTGMKLLLEMELEKGVEIKCSKKG